MKPPPFADRDPRRQLAEFTRPSRGGKVRSAGGGRVELVLALPPRTVSKNARNWAAKAKATKEARTEACIAALIARVQGSICRSWWGATAIVTFYVPDRAKRDPSNLMDRCHPFFDGLQDAGLIEDDCNLIPQFADDPVYVCKDEPRVEITLLERTKPI